jgi:membrane associated rhomboid family serine protease
MSILLVALITLNVVVSLLGFRAFRQEGGRGAEAFLFIPAQVARGENGLGMLAAHFAHGSVVHLAFNMLALYSFGDGVLTALGPARFLLIYAVAGLGSDLVVFALRKDDPTYRCLGASGSVFGIMAAAVVLDPATSVVFVLLPVPIPGPVFLLGYGVISLVLIAQKRRGGISHEGHLGGALLGFAVTVLLAPRGLEPLTRWFAQWL